MQHVCVEEGLDEQEMQPSCHCPTCEALRDPLWEGPYPGYAMMRQPDRPVWLNIAVYRPHYNRGKPHLVDREYVNTRPIDEGDLRTSVVSDWKVLCGNPLLKIVNSFQVGRHVSFDPFGRNRDLTEEMCHICLRRLFLRSPALKEWGEWLPRNR